MGDRWDLIRSKCAEPLELTPEGGLKGGMLRSAWVHIGDRTKDAAREEVEKWAGEVLPHELRFEPVEPAQAIGSLLRRFDDSETVAQLLANDQLSDSILSEILTQLIVHFRAKDLEEVPLSIRYGLAAEQLPEGEIRERGAILKQAIDILRAASEKELVDRLRGVLARFSQALDRRQRPMGAPRRPGANLQLVLDVILFDAGIEPPAARHRLIAALVTDFFEERTARQVKDLLDERYRVLARQQPGEKLDL